MNPASPPAPPGSIRLNKFLAQAGIASRRKADELIAQGKVQVNGRTIYTMGVLIDPGRDHVTCEGRPVTAAAAAAEPVTLLLNKPRGYLSTRHDPQGRPTVLDLIPASYHHLYPVGRLDLDSEGLMLLSDDGELTQLLTHPSFAHEKEYWVQIAGRVPAPALRKLQAGVALDDGVASARVRPLLKIPPEQRFWLDPNLDRRHTWLVFILLEGRKRQIRRMCEAVDLHILRLARVRMASLHVGDLAPGKWRVLSQRQRRAVAAMKGEYSVVSNQ